MTTLGAFATLAEFKAYFTSRGGAQLSVDPADDAVLEQLLKQASSHIETQTGRRFMPSVETRYYDVPSVDSDDPRVLKLDGDLLEVLTLTNGDGTAIPSTEYTLRPRNTTPYSAIRLIDNSTYYWASDGAGDTHDVIAVYGIWGFHDRYSKAWATASTANEAMDTTETGYTVADGAPYKTGDIIRFDNELGYISAVSSNDLTITRGENGSTAASHLTSINVTIWQVMAEAKTAVLEIANQAKARRFGQSLNNTETITAGGIVVSPRDIPASAMSFIKTYRRYT